MEVWLCGAATTASTSPARAAAIARAAAQLNASAQDVVRRETDPVAADAEIARLEPSEVVASQAVYDEPVFSQIVREMRVPATPLARDGGDGAAAERRVCEFYGVETLDGFGAFSPAEIAAAAALASPATLVIGEVVRLRATLDWLRSPPESGSR